MSQVLGIKVMDLERAMVDMARRVLAHKERVVVHKLLATVDMCKQSNILPLALGAYVENVAGDEVKVARIEVDLRREVLHAQAVVAQLVHRGWAGLEAQEGSHSWLVRLGVVGEFLWERRDGEAGLPVDQVQGEALGVVYDDALAAAGGVREVLYRPCSGELCGSAHTWF